MAKKSTKPKKPKYLQLREGRYWARVSVPPLLRETIGKRELKEPLGPDRKIAERKLHASVARMFAELDGARRKLQIAEPDSSRLRTPILYALSPEELARDFYQYEVELDLRARNFRFEDGKAVLEGDDPSLLRTPLKVFLQKIAAGKASDDETAAIMGWAVERYRELGMTRVNVGSDEYRALCRLLAAAQLDSIKRAEERDANGIAGESEIELFKSKSVEAERHSSKTIADVVAAYFVELQASGKGRQAERRWRPVFKDLQQFLGHDRISKITQNDIRRWKDALILRLKPKTVKDVHLAAVGAVCSWAVDNGYLSENPVTGVKVRATAEPQEREKGFTNAEAKAVFQAALEYKPSKYAGRHVRELETTTAAKKWTPLLAAYTGARISELTQLRKEDICEYDGIAYIRITPGAGSVKARLYRDVPLHSHLVDLGFQDFVAKSDAGPLFYRDRDSTADETPAEIVSKRVCDWIRSLGVIGKVAPNHGWRHRFKTVGVEAGIYPRILDAMQGHAPRTAGERYGEVTLKTRSDAMAQFPRISVV